MCSSHQPLANGHNHRSIILSMTEATQNTIVIVVLSARPNFVQRKLIRQTYGSIRNINNVHILAVVFMLGGLDDPDGEKTDISELEAESVRFGDVIMGDFVDTYKNLTRKTIMAYEWLESFCQEADIVVKTDDDVVVNMFALTEELRKWTPTMIGSLTFWCGIHWSEIIDRNESSRYYVPYEDYSGEVFPKHCAGVGYVTPMGVIHRIVEEISKSYLGSVCTHEDVFMTGIVPEKINSNQSQPIEFVDKISDWIIYVLSNGVYEDEIYLLKKLQLPANETVDFNEFRKRLGTRIFYLIDQGENFEKIYKRLWYSMEKSFRNENEMAINKSTFFWKI